MIKAIGAVLAKAVHAAGCIARVEAGDGVAEKVMSDEHYQNKPNDDADAEYGNGEKVWVVMHF